ncbi:MULTISPECIES: DeoR/GlpR family DNA-binding transcription regulator [Enterococcus]|uniref:Lactose phosphotransferase system repressor n=2 Tax=Enterococcus alcedinis TaxID=1274384 RepID=A0A917N538_9ENTE|nr:DeoR/GlpR family DNA-binding transcription regulator [Enterococcus alcedinis]MBP2102816.1 DeoR/GlpR family transcriptional regulator of sugar metabolism [Enterococcus alcedinis]GGI66378.1 DeoR family transcriptional regulator [Enterococcus alcedinis]
MDIREKEILTILAKKKFMRTTELAEHLHCSISSVRRALITLEQQKVVIRVRGGVMLTKESNIEFSHTYREGTNPDKKKQMVTLVKDFIGPNMCLFLDSSSTIQQVIDVIITVPNLVVITNSLKTALFLSESNNESLKVFITGGEIKLNTTSVLPSAQDPVYESFRFDLALFSCRGIDSDGVYEASFSQANLKKEMMKRAKQNILLVDDSKFDSTHFFKISNYHDYDAIITNQAPEPHYQELFETKKVELLYP